MEKKDKEKSFTSVGINWYPGHMAKAKREIEDSLKLIDVVVEILDARIPKSSQNPDIEKLINGKKRIVILNKTDLAEKSETIKWINVFEKKNILAIDVDANSGRGIENFIKKIEKYNKKENSIYEMKGRVGKSIRILVLGIPNVGKSSFINRLSKKNSMIVGNKPGVTKQKQWIRLQNNIELMDTPGVLWPKFENQQIALNLCYTGTIKDEILPKIEIAYKLLQYLVEQHKERIVERYKLREDDIDKILNNDMAENDKIYEIMKMIGKKRGCLISGGNVDDEKIANIILDDFRNGKIGRITLEKVVD